MGNYISRKKKWVATDGWRGYYEPINAVGGANNTGSWSDSPCPSNVCEREIKSFRAILRKEKIPSALMVTQSSNVFCVHVYVLVPPEFREQSITLAKEHQKNTRLFYSVS